MDFLLPTSTFASHLLIFFECCRHDSKYANWLLYLPFFMNLITFNGVRQWSVKAVPKAKARKNPQPLKNVGIAYRFVSPS